MLDRYPRQIINQKDVHRQCPDYVRSRNLCLAFTRQAIPNQRQQVHYCSTDDYDNCPIYLCSAQRSSRPLGFDRDNMRTSGK